MNDYIDLCIRLRAVAETGCDPDLPHEAADAITELRASRDSMQRVAIDMQEQRDALRQDAERLDFLLAVTTADGNAEDDPRAVAMAVGFIKGLDGRAAIDAARAALKEGREVTESWRQQRSRRMLIAVLALANVVIFGYAAYQLIR